MKKIKILFSFILLICGFSLFAQQNNVSYKEKNVKLQLYPNTTFGKQIKEYWTAKNGKTPNLVAEARYLLPKNNKITIDDISVMARSFSTMEGIEYYSNTNKKYEVLYPECYTVSGKDGKKKIEDMTDGSADGKKIYILQKDNSFGKSVYEVDYKQGNDELSFTSINLDALRYGIITAVSAKALKLTFIINNGGTDNLEFYVLVEGDIASFPFIDDFIKDSFISRLDAVYNWFRKCYEKM